MPIVGVCLGAQLIATTLGGQVAAMDEPEIGWHPISGLPFPAQWTLFLTVSAGRQSSSISMARRVTQLPPGGVGPGQFYAMQDTQAFNVGLTTYGFQYHPEWDQTRSSEQLSKIHSLPRQSFPANRSCKRRTSFMMITAAWVIAMCHTIAMSLFPIDKR